MKKLLSAVLILSFLTVTNVQAVGLKSMEQTIIYNAEVEVVISAMCGIIQHDRVGYKNEFSFAFSSCDDDKQGVTLFDDADD